MSEYAFAVIGGDLRMTWLTQLLAQDGHIVKLFGQEENEFAFSNEIIHCADIETALAHCDACLLGLPCTHDNVTVTAPFSEQSIAFSEITSLLHPKQILLGGKLPALPPQVTAIDYANDESFILSNSIPTAEGALQLLMQHSPDTVFDSHIAITGYGRVAQQLARIFDAVGAHVTIFARSHTARTRATINGYLAKDIRDILLYPTPYDAILNTVPSPLFTSDCLKHVNPHTYLMELASAPGGFDLDAVSRYNLTCISAGGLPGKVAPRAAALYIKNTILNRMEELK